MEISQEAELKLEREQNIWVATVRPDRRPHLVPVWFAWHNGKIYLCIEPGSVKGRNIASNSAIALALEGGSNPVICEGQAATVQHPWPKEVKEIFYQKYEWNIDSEKQYTALIEVTPSKWLVW